MANAPQKASGVVGAILLILSVVQMLKGDDWVVWAILGVLFGGLTFFRRKAPNGESRG